MEKFIAGSSIPIVTIFNKDPSNYEYVNKFFDNSNDKVFSCFSSSIRKFGVLPDASNNV